MKVKVVILLIIAAILCASIIIFATHKSHDNNSGNATGENNGSDNSEGKVILMNVTQYLSDGNYSINKTKHEFFNDYRSLKPGDILIIKGWIAQPPKYRRDERLKVNVTTLTISDSGKKAWPIVIYVNGNVEGKYREGDLVEIRLHIKYYDIHQRWNNETWHIYGELPEESILNGKYTGGEIIVPPEAVRKI